MINICTKYGFDSLIISGSYGGHRRHTTDDGRRTTDDGRRTTPGVWHKLPTGELKINNKIILNNILFYNDSLPLEACDNDYFIKSNKKTQ